MPKREEMEEQFEYDYDEVLTKIRTKIDEEYGGVAKFLESAKFSEMEIGEGKSGKAKIHIYLANQSDKSKTVKSFPVLKKLYKILLDVDLESKVVITRKQVILTSQKI